MECLSRHRMPPGRHFPAEQVGAARSECLRFAEGPHVHLAQPRDERGEYPGRREAVAERIVP